MFFLFSLARFAARGFIKISLIDSRNLHFTRYFAAGDSLRSDTPILLA
jgi:hypothetical protein